MKQTAVHQLKLHLHHQLSQFWLDHAPLIPTALTGFQRCSWSYILTSACPRHAAASPSIRNSRQVRPKVGESGKKQKRFFCVIQRKPKCKQDKLELCDWLFLGERRWVSGVSQWVQAETSGSTKSQSVNNPQSTDSFLHLDVWTDNKWE